MNNAETSDEPDAAKRRIKTLTLAAIQEQVGDRDITILSVTTDIKEDSSAGQNNSWKYVKNTNVYINFTESPCHGEDVHVIHFTTFWKVGFPQLPKERPFRFYSWLRFKMFVKQRHFSLQRCISEKETFISLLLDVNIHYRRHPYYAKNEGLEPTRGP